MKEADKFFRKLTIATEVYIYLVPVPMVVYFIFMNIENTTEKMIFLAVAALVGSVIGIIIGYIMRVLKLKPLLDQLYDDRVLDEKAANELKLKILRYPYFEFFVITMRWISAGSIALFIFSFAPGLVTREFLSIPMGILFAIPLSGISYIFVTEGTIYEPLENSKIASVFSDIYFSRVLTFGNRMLFLISSLMFHVLGITSFFLYYINLGELKIANIWLHLIVFYMFYAVIILYTLYSTNKTTGKGIDRVYNVLLSLSKGEIPKPIPIVSRDEFGKMSYYIYVLINSFARVIDLVKTLSNEVSEGSQKVALNSDNLFGNSQTQSASAEEVAAALNEMDSSIRAIAENAKTSSNQSLTARNLQLELENTSQETSVLSQNALRKVNESMDKIEAGKSVINDAVVKMNGIQEITAKISDIISSINEIADQVNLLSLNASIESARAGEYGRGFAVVAHEVSKLAEKTLENSKEIQKFSKDVTKRVVEGKNSILETSATFEDILVKVGEVNNFIVNVVDKMKTQKMIGQSFNKSFEVSLKMSQSISDATSEQASTNSELLEGINQINNSIDSIVQSASGLSEISGELKEKANLLQKEISFFKIM